MGITAAKLTLVPVRRGYWGNKLGKPHTVPTKVHAKCGSVHVRLIPAPKGAGIVAAGTPKKILKMAGLDDVYTCSRGHTRSMGNFVTATFLAIKNTTLPHPRPVDPDPLPQGAQPGVHGLPREAPEHGRAQAPRRPSGLLESPLLPGPPPLRFPARRPRRGRPRAGGPV